MNELIDPLSFFQIKHGLKTFNERDIERKSQINEEGIFQKPLDFSLPININLSVKF